MSVSENGVYTIKQVAEATGLSTQVIRKWEERYSLVLPDRLPNGYRVYSEQDIQLLTKVKMLADQGFPIRQAATIAKEKLEEGVQVPLPPMFAVQPTYDKETVCKLLESGTVCDEIELNVLLQNAYLQLGLAQFLDSIVIPFLKEVGLRWERGEWDEYQESVSSLVVRDFLVQIRRTHQYRNDAPILIAACLPLERHEIPIHILALKSMMRGYKTIVVAASPAPGAIQSLVKRLKPVKVLLSASTTLPFEESPGLLEEMDAFAATQKSTDFYLGGHGALLYTANRPVKALRITNSFEDVFARK
ncbi:MerR family transcriptional regulator [Sporosarcina sp. Te-1]|uniref:MerR family transcriptional regulator n=1 Tax=Sporosarcina sp. Te-1 TaxID=2818390 RepID=UPI001A9F4FA1|nr:MerR family transcriptional regulator [Sporosarcina sp. Te-1]QTD39889.1 MerR family transcriptional regulator [Sporosarcina sp. Te-1]